MRVNLITQPADRSESGAGTIPLSLTIRPAIRRAHDVAVACCLAMAEVRVQLPLGAFDLECGNSLSLYRVFQDVGKPGIPRVSGARDRRFESGHPDIFAVGPVLVRVGGC